MTETTKTEAILRHALKRALWTLEGIAHDVGSCEWLDDEGPDGTLETARRALAETGSAQELRIVFDRPPSPNGGRFVEVEDTNGKSIRVGCWVARTDGYHELRLGIHDFLSVPAPSEA